MEIVTANRLGDGRVVFQTVGGWSLEIAAAELLHSKPAVEAALARAGSDAAANRVVEPYAIEVRPGPAGLVPVRLRERIRAEGPTTGNSVTERRPPSPLLKGEGSSLPKAAAEDPSPIRFAATLSPQGGEGSGASLVESRA